MKKWIKTGVALLFALGMSWPAQAKVEVKDGKFWFNDVRQEMVWGRSCFKLANQVTFHFTGQGSGHWGLHSAKSFIDFHMNELGVPEGFVCRVFLETAAWSPCEEGAEANNGEPNNCMFGSEPRDTGFWNGSDWNENLEQSNRNQLRDGHRQTSLDPTGEKVIEQFYKWSEETGMAFELVINATTKHDRIPNGEIDHIIRQAGVFMGEKMDVKYPRALIIPNLMNEWNAHSQISLNEVNAWAVRWHRDNYFPHSDAPIMTDGGGANSFAYDVGREDGKYRSGMIHPERGGDEWKTFPSPADMQRLRRDCRGMPCGANESMYYVSANGRNGTVNTLNWYRPGGRTADWADYKTFLFWQLDVNAVRDGYDYFIIHDDKGAQSQTNWPRHMTEVDEWIRDNLGDGGGFEPCDPGFIRDPDTGECVPIPPPPPIQVTYDPIIDHEFNSILGRTNGAGEVGLRVYNDWFINVCLPHYGHPEDVLAFSRCLGSLQHILVMSDEYKRKNTR